MWTEFFKDFFPGVALIFVVWLIGKCIDKLIHRSRKVTPERDAHEIFPGHL